MLLNPRVPFFGQSQLETATTISPVQLAVENEVLGVVKCMIKKTKMS